MNHTRPSFRIFTRLTLLLLFGISLSTNAQTVDESVITEQLNTLQKLIDTNVDARRKIRDTIKDTDSSELPELQNELEIINTDLRKNRITFEQIATDAVDFTETEDNDQPFNWQVELTQILQPLVENLKSLTEKRRKIGQLQTTLEQNAIQKNAIEDAIKSIEKNSKNIKDPATLESLNSLKETWERRALANKQELGITRLQLSELTQSDQSIRTTIKNSLVKFIKGRGLTLLLAIMVGTLVWFAMRALLYVHDNKIKRGDKKVFRTRQRLATYAYRALTGLLILISVVAVFYVRGDILLMGLSILAVVGVVLGLRNTVPRFIHEAQLLLNVGQIREKERVIYEGLPWEVASLNLQTVLRNPELSGVLRLPLREISSMTSRPVGKEPWFPASVDDVILLSDEQLLKVTRITPEVVELTDGGGTITSVLTRDFYGWTFKNITRGKSFGIAMTFGIDYSHQAISLKEVPDKFTSAIKDAIANAGLKADLIDVLVDLSTANDSSLDYLIYISMKASAARKYFKVKRLVQQTCIAVCTDENWNIPFPHLTIQTDPHQATVHQQPAVL